MQKKIVSKTLMVFRHIFLAIIVMSKIFTLFCHYVYLPWQSNPCIGFRNNENSAFHVLVSSSKWIVQIAINTFVTLHNDTAKTSLNCISGSNRVFYKLL